MLLWTKLPKIPLKLRKVFKKQKTKKNFFLKKRRKKTSAAAVKTRNFSNPTYYILLFQLL